MDYELTLKVRNAPFLNVMREAGYQTVGALARASRIPNYYIYKIANLAQSPFNDDGERRNYVSRVMEFLGASLEDIYPERHIHSSLDKSVFVAQVESDQMERLTNVSTQDPMLLLEAFEEEEKYSFENLTAHLTDRERAVFKARVIDGKTFREIGEMFGVSGHRISQINEKAFRKVRGRHGPKF